MSIKKRLPQKQSRTVALEAARGLLIELGPQAVTLKAVASRIGRTHANLLHHFGSASGLQKSLAEYLANAICATIGEAVQASRAGIGSPREVWTSPSMPLTGKAAAHWHHGCCFPATRMRWTRSSRLSTT